MGSHLIDSIETGPAGEKIISPRPILKEKVGTGGFAANSVQNAELVIARNDTDFAPYARGFLTALGLAIAEARLRKRRDREVIKTLLKPAMELKANGTTFKYALVTDVADILLNFLEDLDTLNDDALDIADIHHKALGVIITNHLSGDGGTQGATLSNELYSACQRYARKYAKAE